MKLETEFYRLPLQFEAERLALEIAQFSEADWRSHPQAHPGNSAIALIAVNGNPNDDGVKGAMKPTPYLNRCPYLQQVLASMQTVWGRTRLMRIDAQAEATAHVDTNYYWLQRVRVHIPIVTAPAVQFICNRRSLHMAAGETWIFNTWQWHNVLNPTEQSRIHLVADTVGSAAFWQFVEQAERPFQPNPRASAPQFVPYQPERSVQLPTEQVNFPVVMSPGEQEALLSLFWQDWRAEYDSTNLQAHIQQFQREWRSLWAQYGTDSAGWSSYRQLLAKFQAKLAQYSKMRLSNGCSVTEILQQMLIRPALNPPVVTPSISVKLERPIFIVSAPRSGSTLLFELLARSPSVHTVGGESHVQIEGIPALNPALRGFDSNRLTAADATPAVIAQLQARFIRSLRDRQGQPTTTTRIRLLEKTPKNSLRIPFLTQIFPDARFIYLYRDPRETISSILEGWKSGRFVTYPHLPNWRPLSWSFLLIPEWQQLMGCDLARIAAAQWESANRHVMEDLSQLAGDRYCVVTYDALLENPATTLQRICNFAEITWDQNIPTPLPRSKYTLTAPHPDKWKKNAAALETVLPQIQPTLSQIQQWINVHP